MGQPIEVHRGSVQAWECDQMGHLNVQFYVDKAVQGLHSLALRLGFPPRDLRERGLALVLDRQHLRFHREQRPGAPFYLQAATVSASAGDWTVFEEMRAAASGEVAATFVSDCRFVDARSREPAGLPGGFAERAIASRAEVPEHARPRGLDPHPPRPRPRLDEADALGLFATYEAGVDDAQCDAAGFMTPRHYMGAVADSIPNLLLHLTGVDRSESGRIGGAALEYRFVYHAVPRAGDVLVLRSGLVRVAAKTYTICHWLFDLGSRLAVATAEAVAVAMDLETRRAIEIPDDLRARLESRIVPGLGL